MDHINATSIAGQDNINGMSREKCLFLMSWWMRMTEFGLLTDMGVDEEKWHWTLLPLISYMLSIHPEDMHILEDRVERLNELLLKIEKQQ